MLFNRSAIYQKDKGDNMTEKIKLADRIAHDIASPVTTLRSFLNQTSWPEPVNKLESIRDYLRKTAKTAQLESEVTAIIPQVVFDMRTHLRVIESLVDTAEVAGSDMISYKGVAKRCVEKLKTMITNLETLNDASTRTKASLDTIVESAVSEVKPVADRKNIALIYTGSKDVLVNADESEVNRVVTNLLVNASQAMDQGKISVRLFTFNDTVRVEVVDNGKGILYNHTAKVFKDGFTFGKANGTGVGLAYCKDVIRNHSGSMYVHSLPKNGSIFSVNLPSINSKSFYKDEDSLDVL
jgi:signal transduction histidine kinase